MAKSRGRGGHDLGPHNLLWKLDEIIGRLPNKIGCRDRQSDRNRFSGGFDSKLSRHFSYMYTWMDLYHTALDFKSPPVSCSIRIRLEKMSFPSVWLPARIEEFLAGQCLYGSIHAHEACPTEDLSSELCGLPY